MIRESSIALAELIVVGGGTVRPGQIIQGLNGESIGALPFTDNFRTEIVQATTEGSYDAALEASSERLAEIIRGALNNMKTYGVPMAKKVLADARLLYDPKQLRGLVDDIFQVEYINVNNPFFESQLYPTEVKDQTLGYTGVDLTGLNNLKWTYPSDEDIRKFINSSHPDILTILNTDDVALSYANDCLTNLAELKDLFVNNDGVFNFSQIKSVRFDLLMKMYVLLTKMYYSDDQVPWLETGDLSTYRAYVSQLWNGMTLYLITLKKVVSSYNARKLVIVNDRAPRLTAHPHRSYGETRFMDGSVKVFYTDDLLAKLEEAGLSFGEVISGYHWANLTSGQTMTLPTVVENPAGAAKYFADYTQTINTTLSAQSKELFVKTGLKAIEDFIVAHPPLLERANAMRGNKNQILSSWVYDNFFSELEKAHYLLADRFGGGDEAVVVGDDNGTDARLELLLSTDLVPCFLRACGSTMTAEIIEDTFIDDGCDDNITDKRSRLTVAVINTIVGRLLEG